jgi:protein-S-isoprenylcysteine O-methyltransferase Ste14
MAISLDVTGLIWLVLELGLIRRDRRRGTGRTERDRGTRTLNFVLVIAAVVLAEVLGAVIGRHSPLWLPGAWRTGAGPAGWPVIAGLAVIWLGLAIRVWAVAALGRAFRTTVEVDSGQALVTRGPYHWVRHPSYTGLLLIAAGFGLAFGNWPGLAACVLLPAAAMLRRIRVEENELLRVLGTDYSQYQKSTRRLVPGLW